MTDKDIKDYCKNCDVEPPAMRFKCPECEHNPNNENNFAKDINAPHKEQIIINGVDVSECLFYQSNFEEDYDVKIKHFCSNWHNSCESANNSNCYFKQLARKTQECVKLNCEIIDMNSIIEDAAINLGNKDFTLYDLPFEIKKLRQECKALKSESFTREELIGIQEKDIDRYRKALGEIEKELKEDIYCENQECGCDDFEECLKCTKEHILDIINKAKGKGDD